MIGRTSYKVHLADCVLEISFYSEKGKAYAQENQTKKRKAYRGLFLTKWLHRNTSESEVIKKKQIQAYRNRRLRTLAYMQHKGQERHSCVWKTGEAAKLNH